MRVTIYFYEGWEKGENLCSIYNLAPQKILIDDFLCTNTINLQ